MISDLYKCEMTISEISNEYDIVKSTINGWIKPNKEIKISKDEVIKLKEVSKLKKKFLELNKKIKYYIEASFS